MHSLADLDTVLGYQNPRVVERFIRNFPEKKDNAEQLFQDMLTYLWISKKHAEEREAASENQALNFDFVMHEEMRDMDEMWHCFILYTKDYFTFCEKYFGKYLHHIPNVVQDRPQSQEDFIQDLEKYLAYVYDRLGPSTIERWFA